MAVKLTLYQSHVKTWKNCTACELSQTRRSVVFARGKLPCDVLFLGEAPGTSEDMLGEPFVGPSGILLDDIIAQALVDSDWDGARLAFSNLLCCIPRGDDGHGTQPPTKDQVMACSDRLKEFVKIAKPSLIVCVGTEAEKFLTPGGVSKKWVDVGPIEKVAIQHPGAILRSNPGAQGLQIQRCEVILTDAFEKLISKPKPKPKLKGKVKWNRS